MTTNNRILEELDRLFANPKCALVFSNEFECLISVLLSAQTTDKSVNKVTPSLFRKYPTPSLLAEANLEEVENIIKPIGIYKNKSKNIIALSQKLVSDYGGAVPNKKEELAKLPGVGNKTANVVLAECFFVPAIAVDTHVSRVSKRLGLAKEGDGPLEIEKRLEKRFPPEKWIRLHHQLILFGREICHAKNPSCGRCPFIGDCPYLKKASKTAGK